MQRGFGIPRQAGGKSIPSLHTYGKIQFFRKEGHRRFKGQLTGRFTNTGKAFVLRATGGAKVPHRQPEPEMSHRSKAAPAAATPASWLATHDDFLQSLDAAQRHWHAQREAGRERALQEVLTMLSRGLAPLVAIHGELLEQRLHATRGDEPIPVISVQALNACFTTRDLVDTTPRGTKAKKPASRRGQAPELRIGRHSKALAGLHADKRVDESVFVTAWNPFGQREDEAYNREANAALRDWLEARGFETLAGRGVGEGRDWPAEESFLVPGADAGLARALCLRFRQNAVMHSGKDAVPRLVLHPAAVLA